MNNQFAVLIFVVSLTQISFAQLKPACRVSSSSNGIILSVELTTGSPTEQIIKMVYEKENFEVFNTGSTFSLFDSDKEVFHTDSVAYGMTHIQFQAKSNERLSFTMRPEDPRHNCLFGGPIYEKFFSVMKKYAGEIDSLELIVRPEDGTEVLRIGTDIICQEISEARFCRTLF